MSLAIRSLARYEPICKKERPLELSAALFNSWLPTLDNLRNFLMTPMTEMLSFFQILQAQWSGTQRTELQKES
jgi:hypothetical protein